MHYMYFASARCKYTLQSSSFRFKSLFLQRKALKLRSASVCMTKRAAKRPQVGDEMSCIACELKRNVLLPSRPSALCSSRGGSGPRRSPKGSTYDTTFGVTWRKMKCPASRALVLDSKLTTIVLSTLARARLTMLAVGISLEGKTPRNFLGFFLASAM